MSIRRRFALVGLGVAVLAAACGGTNAAAPLAENPIANVAVSPTIAAAAASSTVETTTSTTVAPATTLAPTTTELKLPQPERVPSDPYFPEPDVVIGKITIPKIKLDAGGGDPSKVKGPAFAGTWTFSFLGCTRRRMNHSDGYQTELGGTRIVDVYVLKARRRIHGHIKRVGFGVRCTQEVDMQMLTKTGPDGGTRHG